MRIDTNTTLEFNNILEKLSGYALSEKAKEELLLLTPSLNEDRCRLNMKETTEALQILTINGNPPLSSMTDLEKILELTEKGAMLDPLQLSTISNFIYNSQRMKKYLKKSEYLEISLAFYGISLNEMEKLLTDIESSIRNGKVIETATNTLRDINRKIEKANSSIKLKLETILKSKKDYFIDNYITSRNGKYVLPLKKEFKNQLVGSIIDSSKTAYFIEPSSVKKLQDEIYNLKIEEDNEIRKILYTLTALVEESIVEIKMNVECMEKLDFVFAKAKLSQEMGAIPVILTTGRSIKIVQGRHPLLEKCVPLDFSIGDDIKGIIITGPNTGGKTVALKTVGLLSLMAQSGLHVPVAVGSEFSMHSEILCDIGDGQSITENLSTFSSHIINIIEILEKATSESLILLDELGSGTDPQEGMGIAIAILEELRQKNCLFLETTHYPEVKEFAKNKSSVTNARMEFNKENFEPLYKLQIGEAGESCALYIAQKLGFPDHLLNRARQEAYDREIVNYAKSSSHKIAVSETNKINKTSQIDKIRDMKKTKLSSKIKKTIIPVKKRCDTFNIGDSVTVYPQKSIGIICKPANDRGELLIQIKNEKHLINHKRIKLLAPASELYPEDYDFSIIFDTVANRKARHDMSRLHNENLIITEDLS